MPRTHVWWRTRGPKKTAKETITKGKVRIKQVRSGIGHSWRMRLTLEALGLRHHQSEVTRHSSLSACPKICPKIIRISVTQKEPSS